MFWTNRRNRFWIVCLNKIEIQTNLQDCFLAKKIEDHWLTLRSLQIRNYMAEIFFYGLILTMNKITFILIAPFWMRRKLKKKENHFFNLLKNICTTFVFVCPSCCWTSWKINWSELWCYTDYLSCSTKRHLGFGRTRSVQQRSERCHTDRQTSKIPKKWRQTIFLSFCQKLFIKWFN